MFSFIALKYFTNSFLSDDIWVCISSEKYPLFPKSALSLERYSVNAASVLFRSKREDMAINAADSSVPAIIEKEEILYCCKSSVQRHPITPFVLGFIKPFP